MSRQTSSKQTQSCSTHTLVSQYIGFSSKWCRTELHCADNLEKTDGTFPKSPFYGSTSFWETITTYIRMGWAFSQSHWRPISCLSYQLVHSHYCQSLSWAEKKALLRSSPLMRKSSSGKITQTDCSNFLHDRESPLRMLPLFGQRTLTGMVIPWTIQMRKCQVKVTEWHLTWLSKRDVTLTECTAPGHRWYEEFSLTTF